VQTCCALSRSKQSRDIGHLRIRVHLDPAHHVMSRRTNFHGLLRDVDISQLLELVIHAWQLLFYMLRSVRESFLNPRNVEEYAAVRAPASFSHLSTDAASNVVASQQLG